MYDYLTDLVGIRAQDDILEIGCGVRRIGFGLAPRCRYWTGADISSNMLAYAADRLRGLPNVRVAPEPHGPGLRAGHSPFIARIHRKTSTGPPTPPKAPATAVVS